MINKYIYGKYLNKVINESIKTLITEISIKDKYSKELQMGKTNLSFDEYEFLCNIDPTTKPNKVGKYTNWILAKYTPDTDWNKLKRCIEWYADGIKRNIIKQLGIDNDINNFKSYDEFINTINDIISNNDVQISNSEYNNREKYKGQFEILGSTSFYDIIAPLTYEAERYFGSHTEWCTVANIKYFDSYMSDGQLYIIYPKNGDDEMKMQFHFESKSFANKYDDVENNALLCMSSVITDENVLFELLNLCKKIWNNSQNLQYFLNSDERINYIENALKNGANPKHLFDCMGNFGEDGTARIELDGKWGILDKTNTMIVTPQFDFIYKFHNNRARVSYNDLFGAIDYAGNIIVKPIYDYIGEFSKKGATISKDKKKGLVNFDGDVIIEPQYDEIGFFEDGLAPVRVNKKWGFINMRNELVIEPIYDNARMFENGFALVGLNGERYYIDVNNNLYNGYTRKPITESTFNIKWIL